jgi:hypothetical protein
LPQLLAWIVTPALAGGARESSKKGFGFGNTAPRSGREPAGARRSAPGTVAPAPESSPKPIQPPAPAEPENQEDKKQFSLFL